MEICFVDTCRVVEVLRSLVFLEQHVHCLKWRDHVVCIYPFLLPPYILIPNTNHTVTFIFLWFTKYTNVIHDKLPYCWPIFMKYFLDFTRDFLTLSQNIWPLEFQHASQWLTWPDFGAGDWSLRWTLTLDRSRASVSWLCFFYWCFTYAIWSVVECVSTILVTSVTVLFKLSRML